MESLKALREKRNKAVETAQKIIESAEAESRSLSVEERSSLKSAQAEVKGIEESISLINEQRSLEGKIVEKSKEKKEERKGAKKVDQKTAEKRAVESYLKLKGDAEIRALNADYKESINQESTSGNGGITIPTYINNDIIELLNESAPVLAAVRKFTTANGNLKVIREDSFEEAGFVGEEADVSKISGKLKSVLLSEKRAGAATQLTNQLILDSAFDIVSYVTGKLTRSLAKTLERAILVGNKGTADSFRPIVGAEGVTQVKSTGKFDVSSVLDIYDSINPEYLAGSMFVVSRPAFNAMTKLQDGDGTYLIFRGIVDGKPGFSFKGIPVYVSDVLNDADQDIVFGNFEAGYGFMERQGLHLTNVTSDTQQALAGGSLVVLDGYFDGAVINPNALVTASSGASGSSSSSKK